MLVTSDPPRNEGKEGHGKAREDETHLVKRCVTSRGSCQVKPLPPTALYIQIKQAASLQRQSWRSSGKQITALMSRFLLQRAWWHAGEQAVRCSAFFGLPNGGSCRRCTCCTVLYPYTVPCPSLESGKGCLSLSKGTEMYYPGLD